MNMTNLLVLCAICINPVIFIPQIYKNIKGQRTESISLLTFLGISFIELMAFGYSIIQNNTLLAISSLLSIVFCIVIALHILSKKKNSSSVHNIISAEEILAQIPGHIYWKNENGVCLGASTENWHNFGSSSLDEFIGKTDYDLFPKDVADRIVAADNLVLKTQQKQIFEERDFRPDGTSRLYLSQKAPLYKGQKLLGTIGVSIDITDARKAEIERLIMLESIISVMPGNVYWMDKNEVYLGCNDNVAASLQLPSTKDIIGKRNCDFLSPEFTAIFDTNNREVLATGSPLIIEEPFITTDGKTTTFLSYKVPIKGNDSEIIGMVGISFDISDRKKAEIELKEAKEKAEVANKAKTLFLANASHELRVPLTGIISVADMFNSGMVNSMEEVREYAKIMLDSSKYLLTNIDSILYFAKLESEKYLLNLESVNLKAFIQDLCTIFSVSAHQKNLKFECHFLPGMPENVYADATALRHIVSNIINNAIRYTDQGWIKVETKVLDASDKEALIEISVSDSGIGIPADKINAIFEKFTQVEESYIRKHSLSGFGLGLAIVKKFVDLMNANILVESELGHGSCFRFQCRFKLDNLQ